MDKLAIEMQQIFLKANEKMLKQDIELFSNNVSERTICGALLHHLYRILSKTEFSSYYVDVEYNRNKNRNIKTCCVSYNIDELKVININCDLIVHSRGKILGQDNLIAIEMKKSTRSRLQKDADRNRLIALTKNSYNDVWSFDGKTLPEYVCGYKIGIYYEINFRMKQILIEYYYKGILFFNAYINY